MRTTDFDYDLPEHFIAQNPAEPRDSSRLMVYDAASDTVYHRRFFDIKEFLSAKDLLVVNRSRVIPARLLFSVNGAEKEIFLLRRYSDDQYQAMVRPGKYFKVGREFKLNGLAGMVAEVFEDGSRLLKFNCGGELLDERLFALGRTPLPPYITESTADDQRYQTVYSNESGSVAAPTAGLHFTEELLEELLKQGVNRAEVLLHVGRGTFLPVSSDDLEGHQMHSEIFQLDEKNAELLQSAQDADKRLIAVGTTSVRVLETIASAGNGFVSSSGETDIFIYPGGYEWKAVNGLITNFHLPKSTLIMLVASFLESKGCKNPVAKILELYELAKDEGYRFYSFGDAMFIY